VKLCDFGFSKDTMLHSAPASQVRRALRDCASACAPRAPPLCWGAGGPRPERPGRAARRLAGPKAAWTLDTSTACPPSARRFAS
jgi:hypothetical protein